MCKPVSTRISNDASHHTVRKPLTSTMEIYLERILKQKEPQWHLERKRNFKLIMKCHEVRVKSVQNISIHLNLFLEIFYPFVIKIIIQTISVFFFNAWSSLIDFISHMNNKLRGHLIAKHEFILIILKIIGNPFLIAEKLIWRDICNVVSIY